MWTDEIKKYIEAQLEKKKVNSSNFGKFPAFLKAIKYRPASHVCFILDFSNLSDIITIKKTF